MIKLTTVVIHCNKEFETAEELELFKTKLTNWTAETLPGTKPVVYNTYETTHLLTNK